MISSIDAPIIEGSRDCALIAVCLFSFARTEAALGIDVEDYYTQANEARRPLMDPETTKLYDRTSDAIILDEVERIAI